MSRPPEPTIIRASRWRRWTTINGHCYVATPSASFFRVSICSLAPAHSTTSNCRCSTADSPRKERRDKALAALTSVGLPAKLRSTPGELSGGQQQRVAIARAIVTEPSTLFADEPTGNLDSVTTRDVMTLLTRLNVDRGITVLVVTHNDEVAACANRTVLIKDGLIESDVSRA